MAEPTTASIYESVPLPLGKSVSIRVITIRPSINGGFDRISCDFHLLDLDTKLLHISTTSTSERGPVQYTALSYTWGEPSAEATINLNGEPFPVRKNLWAFLSQARSNGLEEYLWIDALCINQTVNEERSHQVAIMGRIYSSASRVIVWLGVYSGLAAEGLLWTTAAYLADDLTLDTLPGYEKQLEELFELPYWTRIWIVQEYVLAKSIDIWLGYLKRDGKMFGWLFKRLRIKSEAWWSNRRSFSINYPELEPFYRLRHFPGMSIIIRRESEHNFSLSKDPEGNYLYSAQRLAMIICELGPNMRCTDPRDRVYALLPLLSREASEMLSITPDYSKTTAEVYASVVDALERHKDIADHMLVPRAVRNLEHMLCLGEDEPEIPSL
ncbi:uncharacterized protein EKO05_0001071 [Ascochyta rabiei]|uniref:Uncharacterized protein n=1 Tax=Didymella rabiei TaxID=5454 RepID=A0A163EPX1_DIDRA|nr:uncharacterized protein EKO05_0001071 [Ascochyta rabiei]KZM23833.1 hypothetical protein ST47_g4997 [Ascochyta rabiei]UPX10410.1 hypothetical protein EKO05_0001071 [Ascochyta rabiei]